MTDISWINQQALKGKQPAGTVTIKVDPKSVSNITQRIAPYKSLPDKFRPAMQALADYYTGTAIPRTFNSEGPGWRPLSKRTQRERSLLGYGPRHPMLRRTGDLFKELTEKAHSHHIETITVGQTSRLVVGGSSTKFIRNQLGDTILRIPARPMLPGTGWITISAEDQAAMDQILTEKVKEIMANAQQL